jgi:hypothetical protein
VDHRCGHHVSDGAVLLKVCSRASGTALPDMYGIVILP